jgi:hypothetical protein
MQSQPSPARSRDNTRDGGKPLRQERQALLIDGGELCPPYQKRL